LDLDCGHSLQTLGLMMQQPVGWMSNHRCDDACSGTNYVAVLL